ncbi:MAG: LacI family DNA-binding transcriptional regulator [Anaerolineae bacterium]|nr:LacI family DNA-binding transcriptional regulator [Anaerolineae bacterium]
MQKKSSYKPTQSDVAALAGVSQTTVSLVLNDEDIASIPPETRKKVLDAIETLGYVPNSAARILRTNRTFALACIIPDITNPFYPTFVNGIQDEAEQNGYEVIIYNTHGLAEKEAKVLKTIQEGRVDGMIGVFFHAKAQDFLPLLTRQIPVVRLEVRQHQSGSWPLDSIFIDNVKAAHAATSYLISEGHKQIALITGWDGPARARREGYLQALESATEPYTPWIQDISIFNEEGGYAGMQAILKEGQVPSAVFAGNDLLAIGAMQAIKAAGLRIPQDVAVVGFDDIQVARLISPSLTTIRQAQDEIGKRAAALMIERLQREDHFDGRVIEMPFELIIRESA